MNSRCQYQLLTGDRRWAGVCVCERIRVKDGEGERERVRESEEERDRLGQTVWPS